MDSQIVPEKKLENKPKEKGQLPDQALALLLNEDKPRFWKRPIIWVSAVILLALLLSAYFWQRQQQVNALPSYTTETIAKGELVLTVTANGSLQPTRSVNIGSELSGTVSQVLVDVNDVVKKGQVLVELDKSKLQDQVKRSEAALAAARAAVTLAGATVKECQANLNRLEQVYQISNGKVPSAAELDTSRASLQRAIANELSMRASVESASAALSTDHTNFARASIRAPANGVILTRNVDPGNAVAASLQAVTLFVIAEDLHRMRLQVNIDEADVGTVKIGQQALFSVSAYANRNYPAKITRVAFGSVITENVVTYLTLLDVDNQDLSLRPGMTATANIIADERHGVLLVPNTALRFSPSKATKSAAKQGIVANLIPRMPSRPGKQVSNAVAQTKTEHQVWVLREGKAVAVNITTGISNGKMSEIIAGDLHEGMQVITDQLSSQ
jgi:HlyD family secretion protein